MTHHSIVQLVSLSHLAATLFMVGLIWFVQVVHYPLFARVDVSAFVPYEQRHTLLTTRVVLGPMLVELAAALMLLWFRPEPVPLSWAIGGVALLAVIWLSTMMIQVPCHTRLARGFDAAVHHRLVVSNWVRTVAWTLRGALALLMVAAWVRPG